MILEKTSSGFHCVIERLVYLDNCLKTVLSNIIISNVQCS